jgi:hypothetical protein
MTSHPSKAKRRDSAAHASPNLSSTDAWYRCTLRHCSHDGMALPRKLEMPVPVFLTGS